jgi:hypothetical protein
MPVDWKEAQQKAACTARRAVTMAKVRIRRVASRTRWQFVTFYGKSGGECAGIVDMGRGTDRRSRLYRREILRGPSDSVVA